MTRQTNQQPQHSYNMPRRSRRQNLSLFTRVGGGRQFAEVVVQVGNEMIRCVFDVSGRVVVQRLRYTREARRQVVNRQIVNRVGGERRERRARYRFNCIVCKNTCGTKQKHNSGCPDCVDHDVRPTPLGEVRATGVCVDCAAKWRETNEGKEVCVTCNREVA